MAYTVTSKAGMTPWATTETVAQALAESLKAVRQGLDGQVIDDAGNGDPEVTAADVRRAEEILGWDLDASSMDRPVRISDVAASLGSAFPGRD